jgi:hypothetical protein
MVMAMISTKSIDSEIKGLLKECNGCSDDCKNCSILEEVNELRLTYLREMIDEDLEFDCLNCEGKFCKYCAVTKEMDWRRQVRTGRDVYHDGSIIEGGGCSQPEWMDNDQYGEYKMSAEYAHEVSYVDFDEPYYEEDYY